MDETHLYFFRRGTTGQEGAELQRYAKATGAVSTVFTGASGRSVLVGDSIYVLRLRPTGGDSELLGVPKAGGDPVTLGVASGEPTSLAFAPDGTLVFATQYGSGPHEGLWRYRDGGSVEPLASFSRASAVAASDDAAFVIHQSPQDGSALSRVSLGDGSSRVLLERTDYASSLLLAGNELLSWGSREIQRFVISPMKAERSLLAEIPGAVTGLALDERHVYFADGGRYYDDLPPPKPADIPGTIRRVARGGGEDEVLFTEGRGLGGVLVDRCFLYWASERGLVRTKKPD